MKLKKLYIGLLAMVAFMGNVACSEDEGPAPTVIEGTSITTVSKPGQVILHWTIPTDPNYYYVKVKYNVPGKGECVRMASAYADSLLVDDLYAKYGSIDFTVTTVTRQGAESAPYTVSAQAGRVPATTTTTETPIELAASGLWTDAQEASEGPIANLVDGSVTTYFHMTWNGATPFPHYIVVDMGEEVSDIIALQYITRDNANGDNPDQITFFGSNEFNRSLNDLSKADQITVWSALPGTRAVSVKKEIELPNAYRYLWLRVDSSTSGSKWVALAELSIAKVHRTVVDPEAE